MAAADLIVATGGAGMVKAAYSSGTPAYGVGPGNPPVILDRDFDIEEAVPIMAEASSFENGILCDGCNHFLYPVEKEAEVFEAWRKGNIVVFDKKEDVDKFREVMFPDGKANAEIIGHDADVIAKAAGFDVPKETEVIALKIDKIGAEEILTHEFLGPTMTMITYETFEEAVDKALKILTEQGGIGHGTGVLSHNEDHIRYVAEKIPVSRLMINQPSSDGWGPSHNGLPPTMSESCGTWGNNILAGNVDYIHFLNITRIARRLDKEWPDAEEMFK
jgi:succinate-semialdehyde dehydrogenase